MPDELNYEWARRRKTIVYRGRPMEVTVQNREGGHRHQVHEYLGHDEPYTETFGLKAGTYSFEVIVAGTNYDLELQKHIAVFEKKGRGRLTLWHGKDRFVVCRRWRITERSDSAGTAKVAVEFVDAGARVQPGIVQSSATILAALVDAIKAEAAAVFAVVSENTAAIQSLASSMADLGTQVADVFEESMAAADEAAGLASDMATDLLTFRDEIESLATDAEGMGESVSGLYDKLQEVGSDFGRRFDSIAAMSIFGDSVSPVPETVTNNGQLREINQDALILMVEAMAVAELADVAIRITFDSAQEAAELRNTLAALMDRSILAAGNAGDDATYTLLRNAKSVAVSDLDLKAARLPTRVELQFDFVMPALVLSHRLYGTNARATEIVEANGIRHPGFVPASEVIEVISPETSTATL